ncbi:protein of unknown function-containing protein [Forsythia ovata]|uniref:Uncharacterized protein n=1 Tax=Forsythia ovata TaxID=205694 RepID=A0ABD1SPF1_9LAMI
MDLAAKKVAVAEIREENRILLTNLNDVADPNLREFIRSEQKRIVQKRSDELAKQSQSTSTPLSSEDWGEKPWPVAFLQYLKVPLNVVELERDLKSMVDFLEQV